MNAPGRRRRNPLPEAICSFNASQDSSVSTRMCRARAASHRVFLSDWFHEKRGIGELLRNGPTDATHKSASPFIPLFKAFQNVNSRAAS